MSLSLPLGSVSFNQKEMTFCLADPTSLPRLKFRATKKPTGTGSREEGRFRMIDKSRSYSVVYDRGIDPFQDPFPIPQMVHSRPTQPTGVKLQNKSVHFILVGIQSGSSKVRARSSLSCAS